LNSLMGHPTAKLKATFLKLKLRGLGACCFDRVVEPQAIRFIIPFQTTILPQLSHFIYLGTRAPPQFLFQRSLGRTAHELWRGARRVALCQALDFTVSEIGDVLQLQMHGPLEATNWSELQGIMHERPGLVYAGFGSSGSD